MAVSIRLQRVGKPHQAYYRLVAIEKGRGQHGKPIEVLGSYDPRGAKIKDKLQVKLERVGYWMKNGARASETAAALLKSLEKHARQEQPAGAKS
ncbi:MAG: 30S ribosomal protein S16 [Elusimicrobia bacterium]|nr:30S ribosomal protein S16 [Elusimicrobiota bacterium]